MREDRNTRRSTPDADRGEEERVDRADSGGMEGLRGFQVTGERAKFRAGRSRKGRKRAERTHAGGVAEETGDRDDDGRTARATEGVGRPALGGAV
jgi:hypothetical protein